MDWNKLSEELLKRLDLLGAKLGQAGSYMWTLAVRQAYVDGIEALLLVAICIGLLTMVACTMKKYVAWGEDDGWDHGGIFIIGFAYVITIIGSLIGFFVNADIAINALLNPQFYALKQLLEAVK